MVDQNNNFYITDIESMQVNYDALNVRYQITWSLFDGSEKEAEFIGGYFDGIYSGHRPNDFNYNIMFTIILNFFWKRIRSIKILILWNLKPISQNVKNYLLKLTN